MPLAPWRRVQPGGTKLVREELSKRENEREEKQNGRGKWREWRKVEERSGFI
jgi:hypothetical protein